MGLLINGELVEDSVIRQEAAAMRPQYEAVMQGRDPVQLEMQLREWARENVIERVLLRQEALRDTAPIPEELINEALKEIRSQTAGRAGCSSHAEVRRAIETRIRIEALVEKITGKTAIPEAAEIRGYYQKHADRLWTPEAVRASHIVKNIDELTDEAAARDGIEHAAAELGSGADFEQVADKYSDCAGSGGDLGWFPKGQMVDEFDAVVFALQPGDVSPVFRTPFGFHIAKVIAKRPAGVRSLAEASAEIKQTLLHQRREKAMEDFVDGLRKKAEVKQVKGA